MLAAAPATAPSATIITGLGNCLIFLEIVLTNSAIKTRDSMSSASTARFISLKSPPTEKIFPSADRIMNFTSSFFSASSRAAKIS